MYRVVKSTTLGLLLSTALPTSLMTSAFAQSENNDIGDQIVVTGSRIVRTELQSSTPVQVLNSERLAFDGTTNIADLLIELPAVGTPGLSRTLGNFDANNVGVATINLRNVGDQRTLVLQNGRRVVSGVGGDSTVNLNNIPIDLLDRVEVITGGASAVYGSEAVAGVVNFVLKDDFEGFRLRTQGNISDEGDAGRFLVTATAGFNLNDRGNVTVYGSYDRDDGLKSRDRSFSAQDNPGNSGIPPQGRFFVDVGNDTSQWTFDPDNTLINSFDASVNGQNRNNDRLASLPLERYSGAVLANYELTDRVKAFAELTYTQASSTGMLDGFITVNSFAIQPDGTPYAGLTLDNPLIPAPIRADMIANGDNELAFFKRLTGVYNRAAETETDFFRSVIGFEGDLNENWRWDASFNYGRSTVDRTNGTGFNQRYFFGLDAIEDPSNPGQVICRDAGARAEGCVPIDIFGFDSISDEAIAYITNDGFQRTYDAEVEQTVLMANVTGSVLALPAGDVQVAAGIERRTEESTERFDEPTQLGQTFDLQLTNTDGDYTVTEVYGETIIPLLAAKPFVEYLGFEAAVRYSDYSTVGGVWNWKVGGDWAPSNDLRFRAVYSQAVRAPNIGELFSAQSEFAPQGLTDPCEDVTATSNRPQDDYCRTLPGVQQQIADSGTFQYINSIDNSTILATEGGNPDLQEETAKTLTVGLVLTPQIWPRFTMTVDYFNIEIEDAVTTLDPQFIINDCVNSGGSSAQCDLFVRENANPIRPRSPGTIFTLDAIAINAANIKTSGVDVQANYTQPLSNNADLDFAFTYSYLDELSVQSFPTAEPFENKGQLNSVSAGRLGAGFEHRANLSSTYTHGNFRLNWRINYLGEIQDTIDNPGLAPQFNKIDAYVYHDLQARYQFKDQPGVEAYFGIDNVGDKQPPEIGLLGASNVLGTGTAAATYDVIGRFFYAGIDLRF